MADIQPIGRAFTLEVLSPQGLQALREATLVILEEVGVRFPSQTALDTFAAHGAIIEADRQIVRLPANMVENSMQKAPRSFCLGGRAPGTELWLNGSQSYFCTDGSGVVTVDTESGERRASRKADVGLMARVADHLSSIAFYWPMVSAQDFGRLAPLHELEASFNNTVKHVQTETAVDVIQARYAVRMAEVIAGDRDHMRENPPLSALICTIAPLGQDREGIEAGMIYAQAGIPVGFMSMPSLGATGPASVAGSLTQATAEIISALVLMQLVAPGAPVFFSIVSSVMHPQTAEYINAISEKFLMHAAAVQIAHDWGVPVLGGAFGAEGGGVDTWKRGRDSVYNALLTALAGADTVVGLGLLEASTVLAPEQILLDDEIYHMNRVLAGGIEMGAESLALEPIRSVGPGGHYLSQDHTRRNVRELWIPDLSYPSATTSQDESTATRANARERLAQIIARHAPEPLEGAKQAELRAILEAAENADA
jgi:trimethylamine--corrinoid protein Co-methyltransferase